MDDRSVVQQIYTEILEAISSDTRGKVICGKDSSEQVKDQSGDRNHQKKSLSPRQKTNHIIYHNKNKQQ